MKAFIINYNRLTYLRDMVDWCKAHSLEPVIVDNHSDYQPLIDYYGSNPCEVIRLDKNYGHKVLWTGLVKLPHERYIITDPDLDMSGVPDDFLRVLNTGLDRYPDMPKCGLSLEVNDLPDTPEGNFARNWEAQFWAEPLDDLFFNSPVDTTFALYRENHFGYTITGIRADKPYTARHYSWYYTDVNLLPEDEQYYYRTAGESASGKKRLLNNDKQ